MNPIAFVRSLLMMIVFPIFTVFCSISGVIVALTMNNRNLENAIVKFWAGGTLKMFGVRVVETGKENIPDSSCLYLFNHTSFFDIFSLNYCNPQLRFGAKIELFKIPFFGPAMKHFGILPIRRANKEDVFKVYDGAKDRVAQGEQFALSPEGGRNSEEKLLPFKSGPFVFAINSKMPIVPVIIKNANHVLNKNSFLPNRYKVFETISIEYLKPVPVEAYSFDQRNELQKIVYDKMKVYF